MTLTRTASSGGRATARARYRGGLGGKAWDTASPSRRRASIRFVTFDPAVEGLLDLRPGFQASRLADLGEKFLEAEGVSFQGRVVPDVGALVGEVLLEDVDRLLLQAPRLLIGEG